MTQNKKTEKQGCATVDLAELLQKNPSTGPTRAGGSEKQIITQFKLGLQGQYHQQHQSTLKLELATNLNLLNIMGISEGTASLKHE